MAKEELVQTPKDTAMAEMERPSFIPSKGTGTEHITNADMQIPRIVLAQKMSPEVDASEAKFIDGLHIGDMFNGLTKEIYGRGPLKFVILRADPPRGVEFIPREEGGGIKDPNVPLDDPRMQFGADGSKPVATKFYDYIILLAPFTENPLERLVALSFKSTGLAIARQLNALIKLRNAPVYAGIYSLTSAEAQNSKGKFSIFGVANAGWVKDEALFNQLAAFSDSLKNKKIDIEREPGEDDFPPVEETSHGNVGAM